MARCRLLEADCWRPIAEGAMAGGDYGWRESDVCKGRWLGVVEGWLHFVALGQFFGRWFGRGRCLKSVGGRLQDVMLVA
jgi:hypothetical protein